MSGVGPITGEGVSNLAQVLGDFRAAILGYRPFAYWMMSEASGTVMKDETRAHHGTWTTAPTLGTAGGVLGVQHTAATFAAASSQFGTVDATAFGGPTEFTVLALVKHPSVAGAIKVAFDSSGDLTWLGLSAAGLLNFRAGGVTAAGAAADDDAWHLLAGTRSGNSVTAIVDGVAGTPATASSGNFGAGTSFVGKHTSGLYWNGVMSHLAIIPRTLTEAQLLDLWELARGL